MISIGDIVEIRKRDGLWAVMSEALTANPQAGRRWHLRQDRAGSLPHGHNAGEGDLTLIASPPTFTPGMTLQHNGELAEVVEDRGDVVAVFIRRERQLEGGKLNLDGFTEVGRGALVAENINKLKD